MPNFELNTSKLFTPLRLGEILATRAFTAGGQINPMATRKSDCQALGLSTKDGEPAIAFANGPEYDPVTSWASMGAVDAIKWAYTLTGYVDSDEDAEAWVQPFRRLIRTAPGELSLFLSIYAAASWRLSWR